MPPRGLLVDSSSGLTPSPPLPLLPPLPPLPPSPSLLSCWIGHCVDQAAAAREEAAARTAEEAGREVLSAWLPYKGTDEGFGEPATPPRSEAPLCRQFASIAQQTLKKGSWVTMLRILMAASILEPQC